MTKLIGVYGASGFGREVMPLARAQYPDAECVFVDDGANDKELNGYPILSFAKFCEYQANDKKVSIAIANSTVREKLAEKLRSESIEEINIVAGNSVILDAVNMAPGAILCPFVTLTSNIKIGKSFHANIYSYVAHDCVIGDFVTFAPSAKCNGNVHIEDHAYIGTGAVIKQGTPEKPLVIGKGAVIGMGAVVTKSVAPGEVVVGNPAKPLEKK
ncbi:acetyltransferase [Pseudidiomarina atlantica]|uniref:Acetyltransferase n=1 Tax=Pseudidiomarina atlantica TaxID=1517416 RepID=A0A094J9F5_9GAMM|nr:acetyltransferase [Pseudidiomarina atlantica]KFZ29216.1 acetyltransferase [Pseudidiomarina atlantica]